MLHSRSLFTSAALVFIYRDQVAFGQLGIPSLKPHSSRIANPTLRRRLRDRRSPTMVAPALKTPMRNCALAQRASGDKARGTHGGVWAELGEQESDFANLFVIPSTESIWYFKKPDVRPPRKLAGSSTESRSGGYCLNGPASPLMEAHQNFATLMTLILAAGFKIAIRNADPYQGTVSLETHSDQTPLYRGSRPSLWRGHGPISSARQGMENELSLVKY